MRSIIEKLPSQENDSVFNTLFSNDKQVTTQKAHNHDENIGDDNHSDEQQQQFLSSQLWSRCLIRMFSENLWLASQSPQTSFDLQFYSNVTKLTESEQPLPRPSSSTSSSSSLPPTSREEGVGERFQTITMVVSNIDSRGSGGTEDDLRTLLCGSLDACLLTDDEFDDYCGKHGM